MRRPEAGSKVGAITCEGEVQAARALFSGNKTDNGSRRIKPRPRAEAAHLGLALEYHLPFASLLG